MRKFFTLGMALMLAGMMTAQTNINTNQYDGNGFIQTTLPKGYKSQKINDRHTAFQRELPKGVTVPTRDENCTLTLNIQGEFELGYVEYDTDIPGIGGWAMTEMVWPNDVNTFLIPKDSSCRVFLYKQTPNDEGTMYEITLLTYKAVMNEDKTINVNTVDDAIYKISFKPVDKDNKPLNSSVKYYLGYSEYITRGDNGGTIWWLNFQYDDIVFYSNDLKDVDFRFNHTVAYYTEDQTWYGFANSITKGVDSDIVFENKPEDLVNHQQKFNISSDDKGPAYTFICWRDVFFDMPGYFWSDSPNMPGITGGFDPTLVQDRDKPVSIYTNIRTNKDPKPGDINTFFNLVFYRDDQWEDDDDCIPMITAAPFGVNANKQIEVHDFGIFDARYGFAYPMGIDKFLSNDPLCTILESGEVLNNETRTPHLYYQPWYFAGDAGIGGYMVYFGSNNEQRYIDDDVMVEISMNGNTIFKDNIFKFNTEQVVFDAPAPITMRLTNAKTFAAGRFHVNNTEIAIDLTKEGADVYPPALPILRVLNQNNTNVLFVDDPANSKIEFTAGVFTPSLDPEFFDDMIHYTGKPDVKISWSIDGVTFNPLNAVEKVDKFNEAYGNVFTVDLGALTVAEAQEQWIIIKITLTSAAGNSMTQTFDPLFYITSNNGISEQTVNNSGSVAFPNPFSKQITINTEQPLSGDIRLEVYDIAGRTVYQQHITSDNINAFTWNSANVKAGTYFYGIYSKEGVLRGKIVKQ